MNTQTFNPTTTKVLFIKEWAPAQFKAIEKAIVKHFRAKKEVKTLHGYVWTSNANFAGLDINFGLAYTSSGIWACYGVCNTQVYFDMDCRYQYSYFTIGEDGKYYAVLQDTDENELTILL